MGFCSLNKLNIPKTKKHKNNKRLNHSSILKIAAKKMLLTYYREQKLILPEIDLVIDKFKNQKLAPKR